MKKRFFALVCVFAALLATHAFAQIADFTDQSHFGVRPVTAHTMGEFAWQANQIEDNRFIVSAWPVFSGGNVTYFWQTFDKLSGVVNGPNQIAGVSANGAGFNINVPSAVRHLRPALAFTKAPSGVADAYPGVAIGLTVRQQPSNIDDVFVHFLRIDPATQPPTGTQPAYIYDTNRLAVNVSNSGQNADSPAIVAMDSGELVIAWRDTSSVGDIGGRAGINPSLPAPNVGALTAMDIYARRMSQAFDATNPVFGLNDPAVPASTQNISSSLGQDLFPTMATNGTNRVFTAWQSLSAQSDDIGGSGTGPIGGTFGQESTDIFGRYLTVSSTNSDLTLNQGVNFTSSGGTSNLPPALTYNQTLNQVGLLFLDNTTPPVTGGIGGNASLTAVPSGPISAQVPVDDVFFGLYDLNLSQNKLVAVTQSPNVDMLVNLASMSSGGWLVTWAESVSMTQLDIRARMQTFDGTGLAKTAPRQYPRQSVVQSGNPQPVWTFGVSAFSSSSISLSFAMGGTPDDLKAGLMPSAANNQDLYMAYGDPISSGVVNGQVAIQKFIINNGQPIDPSSPPVSVPVEISLRNISSTTSVNVTDVNIVAPAAFTSQGGLTLPTTLPPGGFLNATLTFDVNAPLLGAGQNEFSISTTGLVNGNLTLSSGNGSLSVIGATGGIAGVDLSITMNPPTIRVGDDTSATFTIAISNGGGQDLTGLSFEGALASGMIPANLSGVVFSPAPASATVISGGVEVFTGTVTITSTLASQDWRPGFTLHCTQAGNVGTVTDVVNNPIQIIQAPGNNPNPQQPIGGISNIGGSGGCSLTAGAGSYALLGLLALVSLFVWRRKREMA